MGRNTFETVIGFDCEWPYSKPVYVLSNTLKTLPEQVAGKVELMQGSPHDVVKELNQKGYTDIYVDGGKTVQKFLQEGLIDEMVITTIPILLGGGVSLFSYLGNPIKFSLLKNNVYLDSLVQSHYEKLAANLG
ncbi:dihydrofolate reductase family protein [Legionella sp. W05-934-2]|uniref:dihydrofolate reductase family protein n=1 Tax=Legionella sp. W05-934-2 TaxID=1198649 RepID=UPI003462F569